MKRLLIVNMNGLLSALPSIEEAKDFSVEGMYTEEVDVSEGDLALIYQERARVRVLSDSLPVPQKGDELSMVRKDWLYIAVSSGCIWLV